MVAREAPLDEDLGGRLRRAALADQVDGVMQIGVAVGDLLRKREREPGLHQHVQAPALDFRLLVPWCLCDLRHRRG